MKRALPEQFPEKFRNQSVVPTQGQFLGKWRGTCLACALGIEAIDGSDITTTQALFPYPNDQQNWDDQCDIVAELASLAGFPARYAQGLSDGWEGVGLLPEEDDELYLQGHADGKAGLAACVAAGLFDPWP